jgi:hypothetical protein
LADIIGVSADVIRRRISFWVNQGVLQCIEKDVYRVREDDFDQTGSAPEVGDDDGTQSSLTSAEDEKAGMWLLSKNFIFHFLKNFGASSVDKVHATLSMMLDGFKASPSELRNYLDDLVKQDLLEKEDNLYKVK